MVHVRGVLVVMGVFMPMTVPMPVIAVGVRDDADVGRDQMQLAVPHAALGHQSVGEVAHRVGAALQHRHLQAGIMVEVDVQRRVRQVVVGVVRKVG